MKYDTIIYIGRFSPFHNAHRKTIERALTLAHQVVVVIGSANQPRTVKNPWTYEERRDMILMSMGLMDHQLECRPVEDNLYNDQAWAVEVQRAVAPFTTRGLRVAIIGHEKDNTSFYLNMFPQWEFVEQDLIEPLNATDVRDLYFRDGVNLNYLKGVVPNYVLQNLEAFKNTDHFAQLVREREFIEGYKKQFAQLPYAPTFVTADAVVIQSGNVLMIRRRAEPGRGLMALPGGFLNAETDRSMEDCMLRELREETGIKVPVPVLRGNIKGVKVFDAIGRSLRGRTITHAYKILLPDGELPRVKGSDDAEKAFWIPIGQVKRSDCFEDHYDIIKHFMGI